jgi:chromosome segregation protein
MPAGAVLLSDVVRVAPDHEAAIRQVIGDAVIVESFDAACRLAPTIAIPVATVEGDVLRGAHLVTGGTKGESRGILATKREIKELRERAAADRSALDRLIAETSHFEQAIAHATAAIAGLSAELHRQEKEIVAVDAQLQRATADEGRVTQRRALVATETERVQQEIASLDERQTEARDSIVRLDRDKQAVESVLLEAQRALQAARETSDVLAQRAAEARATHAALVERSSASAADVRRMEDAARDLERRVETCSADLTLMRDQRERLLAAVSEGQLHMDEDVRVLDELRVAMREADDKALSLKTSTEQQEESIRDARRALDAVRALAAELDVTRATAEADLTHLAQQCLDAVNLPLDDVRAEVDRMEEAGEVEPDVAAIRAAEAPDPDEEDDGDTAGLRAGPADEGTDSASQTDSAGPGFSPDTPVTAAGPIRMTAEEAIAELRGKIDKLGPVNMMAIEQFTELESRHTFLTTQRKDLVDSIAQTNEAIRRIDETTHARFREAFSAINANFQQTFSTLFGGGRAGITLLDDTDPLESGIDIVASPPGKRLQNVMLLSGGEKALTAIALMFAIFKYKPSPFCLLDEIDAPLDDANIGRFVEMLRSMLDRTQFIVITHNRKTMEIANRLYGVTMEEPGVSKLISIQLN